MSEDNKKKSLKIMLENNVLLNIALSVFLCVCTLFFVLNIIVTSTWSRYNSFFIAGLLVSAALLLFLSLRVYKKQQQAIKKVMAYSKCIIEGTRQISKGNYDHYFEKNEYEEIDNIMQHFNDMAEMVKYQSMRFEEKEQVDNLLKNGLEKKYEKTNLELLETKEDLEKTESLLVKNEKMAALGELVSTITHDLKTPIGSLVTIISYMENEVHKIDDNFKDNTITRTELSNFLENMTESLAISNQNITDTDKFINSLKKTSISQMQMDKSVFNVRETLEDVLISLKLLIKKEDIHIELDCKDDITIFSYQGALTQILMNLITNAIKHGFYQQDTGNIFIKCYQDQDRLHLKVKDDGVGVAPEHMSMLFDPFFTTAKDRGGTGLGLSIIYNLTHELLNGNITCNSTHGEGITFDISYPIENNN